MFGRRVAFWLTVAGVSLVSPFALNVVADKLPIRGLKRFRDYIYCAPGQGS
jgi:hypothetical protein